MLIWGLGKDELKKASFRVSLVLRIKQTMKWHTVVYVLSALSLCQITFDQVVLSLFYFLSYRPHPIHSMLRWLLPKHSTSGLTGNHCPISRFFQIQAKLPIVHLVEAACLSFIAITKYHSLGGCNNGNSWQFWSPFHWRWLPFHYLHIVGRE